MSRTTRTVGESHMKDLQTRLKNAGSIISREHKFEGATSILRYKDSGLKGRVLSSANELEQLYEKCSPHEAGVANSSVNPIRKLDAEHFQVSIELEIEKDRFIETFRGFLLEGKPVTQDIGMKLSGLHIFTKGAFLKQHKVAQQSESPLGFLIIVYQNSHEGGNIFLHDGQMTRSFTTRSPHTKDHAIQFIGASNRFDLEVKPVKSGYFFVIMYHIYQVGLGSIPRLIVHTQDISLEAKAFKDGLSHILKDDSFMEEGGAIGFGLYSAYPMSLIHDLEDLKGCLVGRDAIILKACEALLPQAQVALQVVYTNRVSHSEFLSPHVLDSNIASNEMDPTRYAVTEKEKDWSTTLIDAGDLKRAPSDIKKITWIKKESKVTEFNVDYTMSKDNSVSSGQLVGRLCFIVDIGPPEGRWNA